MSTPPPGPPLRVRAQASAFYVVGGLALLYVWTFKDSGALVQLLFCAFILADYPFRHFTKPSPARVALGDGRAWRRPVQERARNVVYGLVWAGGGVAFAGQALSLWTDAPLRGLVEMTIAGGLFFLAASCFRAASEAPIVLSISATGIDALGVTEEPLAWKAVRSLSADPLREPEFITLHVRRETPERLAALPDLDETKVVVSLAPAAATAAEVLAVVRRVAPEVAVNLPPRQAESGGVVRPIPGASAV